MIGAKYQALSDRLNEATLRIWLATEAQALGRGGVSTVARATGVSRTTIHAGLNELGSPEAKRGSEKPRERVRSKGGGRKKLTVKDTSLLDDLDALVDPATRGDPQSPLRWTCKSTPRLAEELKGRGHTVSRRTVCGLLAQLGYICNRPARRARVGSILSVTRNFTTSPARSRNTKQPGIRRSQSIPRKRS